MEARYVAGGVHVLTFAVRAPLGFGLQCQIITRASHQKAKRTPNPKCVRREVNAMQLRSSGTRLQEHSLSLARRY